MSVLFQFSLSLSNYEYRRRLANSQEHINAREQESLIRNDVVDEPTTSQSDDAPDTIKVFPKKNFFNTPLLYQNALLYVFSRLFMTTSLVYMPLWLNERSNDPEPPSNMFISEEVRKNTLTVGFNKFSTNEQIIYL